MKKLRVAALLLIIHLLTACIGETIGPDVEFIFPSENANVGSATSEVSMIVQLNSVPSQNADVERISSNGIEFTPNSTPDGSIHWVSDGKVTLSDDGNAVITLHLSNGRTKDHSLSLSMYANASAGMGERFEAVNLAVNNTTGDVYFSDPYEQALVKVDPLNGSRELLYKGETQIFANDNIFWSLSWDGVNQRLYVGENSLSLTNNAPEYQLVFSSLDVQTKVRTVLSESTTVGRNPIFQAKHLELDIHGNIFGASSRPALVVFDALSSASFLVGFHVGNGARFPVAYTAPEELNNEEIRAVAADFAPNFGSKIYLAVATKQAYQAAALYVYDDTTGIIDHVADLSDGENFVYWPTFITLDKLHNRLLMLDSSRVWALSLADYTLTLLSSSNPILTLGHGPELPAQIHSAALHPTAPLMYAAAGSRGVIAINLLTGDRSIVTN